MIIIGAGLAGLACALRLAESSSPGPGGKKLQVTVVEASDGVGGRVRTDVTDDGFLLDRGFHIFLTSYPACRELLDYDALDLQPFYAGADVFYDGEFHRVADPIRHLADGVATLTPLHPIGSIVDKVKVGLLRFQTLLSSNDDIFSASETTTEQALRNYGFSDEMIDRFFRPFIGGIYFDRSLQVTSRLLYFVLRMLATGQNCLPSKGIGAVSEQLRARAEAAGVQIRLNARVDELVDGKSIRLSDGEVLTASRGVVVATEAPQAMRLLGTETFDAKDGEARGTCCLYYDVPGGTPDGFRSPMLYLDGEGSNAVVNNATFLSEVAPSYAPSGHSLLSASTLTACSDVSDDALDALVRGDLSRWFGADEVGKWRLLRVYRIPYAQPPQSPPTNLNRLEQMKLPDGVYACGDWTTSSTLEGVLRSAHRAADSLILS